MRLHRNTMVAVFLAGLLSCRLASASTITHSNYSDFQNGISDGVVQAMQETTTGVPPTGGIGVMPGIGASVINDDFNYATVADASSKYLFLLPNLADHTELATFPSQFLFSGDTPTAPEATAPTAGVLRMHVSRNQDFFNSGLDGQKSPVFAINKTIITGDFVAETKFTIQQDRVNENQRVDGIYIGTPAATDTTEATDVPLDNTTRYVVAGVTADPVNRGITRSRIYPSVNGFPMNYTSTSYIGQTWWVRVVKRGAYFFTYLKNSETAPWAFHNWFKNPDLAANPNGLVVGLVGISWGGTNPSAAQYQDDDFDYLRVNRLGALAGSFTNVFDAGMAADWQTVAFNTNSKQSLKFQLRSGNALSGGTLTDAGAFAGPDGTAGTWFTDDAAQVVPNASGKRYLEYKLAIDSGTPPGGNDTIDPKNLPAFMRSISATFHPAGLSAKLLSNASEFGPDAGGIQTQSGDGDVSLARTQVLLDDFSSTVLDAAWSFDPGYTSLDPTVVGDYSLSERPGYMRLKVGYPQDYYVGTIKFGGVKMLRDLPTGVDINNFEIETEINLEAQQSRFGVLLMWMGPNDYMGIGLARRFADTYDIGPVEDTVLNNAGPGPATYNYGSNTLQLRVSKMGSMVTLAFRDPNSASPSWRVLAYRSTAGAATGGVDFVPVKVGFMGKSYDLADQATVNYDYNYLKVSNLTATGQKDFVLTLPAGSHPDTLLAFGDGLNTLNLRAQVQGPSGFVGPDGTSGTAFTINQPKLPASLDGIATTAVRIFMGSAFGDATPYLHAAGIQYATGANKVERDTNGTDFAAGTVKNGVDTTTIPGIVTPTISSGQPVTDDFGASTTGWLFSNNPPGTSNYSFTESPGFARVNATSPSDTWAPGTALEKPRIALYKSATVTGDFELETLISFPNGRDTDRNQGLAVIQAMPGTPPDANLDLTNLIAFGPYRTDSIRMLRADSNNWADFGPAGYTDNTYYLRLRKVGNLFTGYVSSDGTTWTEAANYTLSHSMPTMYIGFFAKAWFASSGTQPIDFDYFKFTPLSTTGIFESRVLDLGASGLTPVFDTTGGNSAAASLQFRAASTAAALASLPYVGPDGTSGTSYPANADAILTGLSGQFVQYKAAIPGGSQISDVAVFGSASASVPLTAQDAITALRIAGGLATSSAADVSRLDVEKTTTPGKIVVLDAVKIIRTVNGK